MSVYDKLFYKDNDDNDLWINWLEDEMLKPASGWNEMIHSLSGEEAYRHDRFERLQGSNRKKYLIRLLANPENIYGEGGPEVVHFEENEISENTRKLILAWWPYGGW